MDYKLNNLLCLNEEEILNSKIELSIHPGGSDETFLDRWLRHTDEEKEFGNCSDCSYWGWYGNKRNFYPGQTVYSFIRLKNDEWLFISAAKIIDVPKHSIAKVEVLKEYVGLYGRLVVKCKKGDAFARYVFNLGKYINQIIIKEVLPCLYQGEIFEGYDRVNLPFGKLEYIFNGKLSPTYYEALKSITGVYCLTDTHTGKLYIGSATGEGGVAQRWGNYLDSKHGGNKRLIKLYKDKGSDYFEQYFTYTLLEFFGLNYDPEKVKERERYWKRCLDTVEHGYNDNY